MQQMRTISLLTLAVLCIAYLCSNTGCATIVPPSGGPKDTLAPVIAHVNPADKTTGFNEKKITFTFNEYVDLEDPYKNLIISPLPKTFPEVERKLKTVTVKLKDSLLPNTTYVFNFARSIKDITESNRAKDLLYVVSTGTYFDSLQLSGKVIMANTGKPDSTLTVMLHPNLSDSAVVKERPRYIAHLDSTGTFLFRYLAPGTYRLYALKDEGGQYLYTSKQQVFAFADSPVVIKSQNPEPVILHAYVQETETQNGTAPDTENEKENKKDRRLKFATNLLGNQQDLLEPLVFTFEKPLKTLDTTKMVLTTDSNYSVKAKDYKFTLDSTRRKLTMNMQWQEKQQYHLILDKDFAVDSTNKQLLRPDTISFAAKALADYGQVKITFTKIDLSKHPVLLILQGNTIKNAFPITSNLFSLQLYNPGEYDMQILRDDNKNTVWDPGDLFLHRQPELIKPLSRKLNVKSNWTTEFEIRDQLP